MAKVIEIPFSPRIEQQEIINNLKRFNVVICHRRLGKTTLCLNLLVKQALSKPNQFCAYVAPTFSWGKGVAWSQPFTFKHYVRDIPNVKIYDSVCMIEFPNGSKIRIYGADEPDRLRGIGLDAVVLDEVTQMSPNTWFEVILPALSDKKGWSIFIGTPKGSSGLLYNLYQEAEKKDDWYRAKFPASKTTVFKKDVLENLKKEMSDEKYEQEYECSFSQSNRGSYYGKHMAKAEDEGRITDVPYDPNLMVYTAWDIGIDDSTAIIFYQKIKQGSIRIIDYEEDHGEGLPYYLKLLQQKQYYYGMNYFPWDANSRDWSTGKHRSSVLKEYDIPFKIVPKLRIEDGIDAVRRILPRCFFDKNKCAFLIEALKNFQKEYNEKLMKYKDSPVKDWSIHAADAMRYLAVSFKERKNVRRTGKAKVDFNVFEKKKVYNSGKKVQRMYAV